MSAPATDRATIHEKAAAWDDLMNATEADSDAVLAAYQGLRAKVEARERDTSQILILRVPEANMGTATEAMRYAAREVAGARVVVVLGQDGKAIVPKDNIGGMTVSTHLLPEQVKG